MSHKSVKHITLGLLVAPLLLATTVHAVENFKISSYEGGHQIWFEAEEFDERNPEGDQYYLVVDQADAFSQVVTRAGGAGGMIRWTFDISTAGGTGGTWYFWGRVINPSNNSDFMLVEGHPGDDIPNGPPFPGTTSATEFDNSQRVFEENMGPPWVWGRSGHEDGHIKELQDGENSMYIYHRQGNNSVFWDVFLWTDDPDYVPTDDDYRNAKVVLPGTASAPIPENGAPDVSRDAVLSWTAGGSTSPTNGHKLYFSDNIDDVSNGVGAITLTPSSYVVPPRLEFATTYYWRVDEITPNGTIFDGSLWSFTTELFAYPILNVTATASSSAPDKGPENTVNGSGLDSTGLLHGNQGAGTMWLSDTAGPQPAWILFEFDNVYKLHEMLVWNSNESLEPAIGLGFKDVLIEYSDNGVDFVTLGTTHEFARGSGSDDYAHNTTIDMGGVGAKFVRLTANSNFEDILPQFGLSEVRFLSIPVQAGEPDPASGTFDVALDLDLAWRRGREADKHNVYFSDDFQAVVDGTAPVTSVADVGHGPLSLDLGKNYFWRVDEVNDAETPSTWPGEVWNFTTIKSLVIDDFESYNDLDLTDPASNRIFMAWIDGFDNPAINGSVVGYANPPFAEQTIVLSGNQSMPFFYDNSVGNSEATLTLSSQRDWTLKGVGELSLWFRGEPNNAAEKMYVALNGNAEVYNENPDAALITDWTQWNIDMMRFADQGVNLTNVDSISIGAGDKTNPQSGGSGIIYFDNIGLYPERPAPVPKQTNSVFEAEEADMIGSGWRTYRNVASSGGTHIGSNVGDGSDTNAAPGADWVLRYDFTAEAGTYKIVTRIIAPTVDDDSFWIRILDAESQTHEHPGQFGTGWVRFNDIAPGSQWVWDEVHSSDHSGEVVNWTLAAGNYTLEIAKREDGALIDAILITSDLALNPATLP
ncbi:MAG: discoidin domain-containing protein [Planctomycetes bacterium]|nr:discoidin domain-containing protein [Planctomycetota bacterium]